MRQVIILGDPHIGKINGLGKVGIGSHLNSRLVDQINLLEHILDLAIERNINDIIITGDVFEEPKPHPTVIATLLSWLKKCQLYQVQVHIILGNHDLLRAGAVFTSSLDIIAEADLNNTHIYKCIDTIIIGTTAFTLLPFRDKKSFNVISNTDALNLMRDSLLYELSSIPATYNKIIIGHLAIQGSIPVGDEIDDLANELFCPPDMFAGYDYVWMGHVHKPQIMQHNNPYIAHIGSMDISNFGEADHKKHLVIVNCEGEKSFDIYYLPTRPLRKITISVPKDTEDTTAYIINAIDKSKINCQNAIVKLEISLTAPELVSVKKSLIEQYLAKQGTFHLASFTETKKSALIAKTNNTLNTKMDVASAIKTYAQTHLDVSMRDAFIELALDIFHETN